MVLEGVKPSELHKLLHRYLSEFFEVLSGKTSFRLYLVANFPNVLGSKVKINWNKKLKWKGKEIYESDFHIKIPEPTFYRCMFDMLTAQHHIPECHIKSGDIVFDCGAHVGLFSYIAIKKYGAKKVYAFEPLSKTHSILMQNIKNWKIEDFVVPIKKAIYSENGEKEIYYSDRFLGVSSLSNEHEAILTKKETIETTTIDEFVKTYKTKVDFIKMDIEGSEREALKGAKNTIKKFKPRMIISADHKPDDIEVIPELVKSIRDDYQFKIKRNHEINLFFW